MDEKRTTSYIDSNGNKKTGVIQPTYNAGTDYMANMNRAAASGDMGAAAYYETQRNAKIQGEVLDYEPSSLYAQYAKEYTPEETAKLEQGYTPSYSTAKDYQAEINKAAKAGDYAAAAYYEAQRNAKIQGEGLNYAQTGIYSKYLSGIDDARKAALEQGYQTPEEMGYLNSALQQLQSNYSAQIAANDADAAAQTKLAIEQLQRQKEQINEEYAKVNRQLYTDTMKQQKTLPEQLAAAGYTGGLTESAMLRQRITYEQALRENEQARIGAGNDIDLQARETELQQVIAKAQAERDIRNNYLTSYTGIMGQLQGQKNYEEETALAQKNYEAEQALAKQQVAINYAQTMAETLAQYGDFSGYASVTDLNGNRLYTDEQIADMQAAYNAAKTAASVSGGSSYYSGYYPTYEEAQPTVQLVGDPTSLDYSPDEGIFTWNGKRYGSFNTMIEDMNNAGLTEAEESSLRRKIKMYTGKDV